MLRMRVVLQRVQPAGAGRLRAQSLNHGANACYHCNNDGRCEGPESLREDRMASVPRLDWLRATAGSDGTTLIAAGAQDELHGWLLRGDMDPNVSDADPNVGATAQSCPMLGTTGQAATGACDYRELAMTWLSPTQLLGVGINTAGCAIGQVRLGLSSDEAALKLDAGAAPAPYQFGVGVDGSTRCTGSGARSPAAAAMAFDDASAEALGVWLAAKAPITEVPTQNRCRAAALVPIQGLRLRATALETQYQIEPAGDIMQLGQGFDAVAPRLIAVRTDQSAGYVLAFADAQGLQLRRLPALDADDERMTDAPSLPQDQAVDEIALALGGTGESTQELLVVWTSGCDETMRLQAAIFRWTNSGLTQIGEIITLRQGISILGAPAVAYSPRGFHLEQPQGGWSILWREGAAAAAELRVTRIAQFDRFAERAATIRTGDVRLPFVHTAEATPFRYGFVTTGSDPNRDEVRLLSCE
jgi:hypothetical protein